MSKILSETHNGMTVRINTDHLAAAYKREWEQTTQEPITVEVVQGIAYAFGSELAMLRLVNKYRGESRCAFSKPMNVWFFAKN